MIKILFICHGNICRSPMAESIFSHMIKERGLTSLFQVDSAAVSREELGNPVYPPAQSELIRRGLPRSHHHAWQISLNDYDRYDYFICMDNDNYRRMLRIFGSDPQQKCMLLPSRSGQPREVEDPWYSGRFSQVFDTISEGCEVLLEELLRSGQ